MNGFIKKIIKYSSGNNTKTNSSNISKFITGNGTYLFNDSNNRNSNSSIFTNEFLIKSIINKNNTSPYNSYYPTIGNKSKKLVFWQDKNHKKTIKNKLLISNNSSINFNATRTYLSKFTNTKESSYFKNNSLKNIKKKKNYFSRKQLNMDFKTEANDKILSSIEKEKIEQKKEKKLIKLKLNKLLKENSLNICETFQKRNDTFNIKLKNYFKSQKYIKGKDIEKDNFNQNKKGFSSSHNMFNYYYEPLIDSKTNEELMACSLINNLSNEEKKIVSTDPKYFLIDKKKLLIQKLNIILDETLKDKLIREEKTLTESKSKFSKEKNKNDSINDIKTIYNRKKRSKFKINENKINNKLIEYHQQKVIKDITKKKLIDYINSGINDYYKKFYSFSHQNYLKFNQFKEGDFDYKMFNYPLNYKMTKEYQLNKNDKRLQHEDLFHSIKNRKKYKTQYIIKKIKSCQNMIKINYNKSNN